MSAGPDELRARILAAVSAAPAPTRDQHRVRAAAIYAAAAVAMAALFLLAGGVSHSEGRPAWVTGGIVAGEAVIALVVTWMALGRGRSMAGRALWIRVMTATAAPVAVFANLVAWSGSYVEPYARAGLRCMMFTTALASVMLLAITLVRRRTDATHPSAFGSAVGAVSAVWAGLGVDAWCPLTNPGHALVGHALPVVIVALAGMLVGRRFLSFATK
jgi:hypothetical protein